MMDVPGLHPRAKGKEKLDCNVEAGQVCSRWPTGVPRWAKGSRQLWRASNTNQPTWQRRARQLGQQESRSRKATFLQPAPPLPIPHSLVSETPQ